MSEDFRETLPAGLFPNGESVITKARRAASFLMEVRDVPSGAVRATFESHEMALLISCRPDGGAILFAQYGPEGGFVPCLWRISSPPRPVCNIHSRFASADFVWCPDSRRVAWRAGRHVYVFDPHVPHAQACRAIGLADPKAGYAWSPDGALLAGTGGLAPDAVTFWRAGGSFRVMVPGARRVVDCAWMAESGDLLVAIEGEDAMTRLLRHRPGGGFEILHESEFEITRPFTMQGEPCWHESRNGVRHLHGAPFRAISWAADEDVLVPDLAARNPWALVTSARSPLRLERLSADRRDIVFHGSSSHRPAAGVPRSVELTTPSGARSFGFWWHVPSATAACLWIEGGPGLSVSPAWKPLLQSLLRQNISVLAVNYRGSSRYGVRFRQTGTDDDRASDVVAGREFLQARGFSKVVVHASSYGAVLACKALAHFDERVSLVLCALIPCDIPPVRTPCAIAAFHGARDPLQSPEDAKLSLARIAPDSRVQWTVFPDEGHLFHRPSSLEAVRVAICRQAAG
ncbi:MAG: prolyl oligopeptidase family serine peptidase [Terrimicrobiaceae bacterium]|nr:prolyl oligopeptidase family serine peptidase [Terrimicrobiaceae bacterium]